MKSLAALTHPVTARIARQHHRARLAFWLAWDQWMIHPGREARLKRGRHAMLWVALGFFGLGSLAVLGFAQATQPNPNMALQDWAPGDRMLVLGAVGLMLAIAWQLFNRGIDAWIPRARAERWNDTRMVQVEQDMLRAGLKLPLLLTPVEWFLVPYRPSEDEKRQHAAAMLEATLPVVAPISERRPRF